MPIRFEWDSSKAQGNLDKHGVTFDESATVLEDSLSITIPDPIHSQGEARFVTIGVSDRGKTLVVVHTERGESIRIISARLASAAERRKYAES